MFYYLFTTRYTQCQNFGSAPAQHPLLGPLVDLRQKTPEHLLLHPASLLVDRLDQRVDTLIRVLLVCLESLWDRNGSSGEDLLDTGLAGGVLFTVVFLLVSLYVQDIQAADVHPESGVVRVWHA
jgi:hypothetical protein